MAAAGRRLVDQVTERRRRAIEAIAARMTPGDLAAAIQGMEAFAVAAQESITEADLFGWEPAR